MTEQPDAFAVAVREALEPIERGIRGLERRVDWSDRRIEDEYFDSIFEGRLGAEDLRIHVKILPAFDPEQLCGLIEYADAVLGASGVGLRRQRHAYLLVVRDLSEPGAVHVGVRSFNERRCRDVGPRAHRASIAVASLDDEIPWAPGAEDAVPDLRSLDLFRILAAATSAGSEVETIEEAAISSEPPPVAAVASEEAESFDELVGLPVLVVDDDPLVRAMASDALSSGGFEVHVAADWISFRRVIFEVRTGVILLDVKLPGLSGEKLALVASMIPPPKPRVVLYSGIEEAELRALAARVKAFAYLAKDGDVDRMLEAVRGAAREYRSDLAS